MERRPVVGTSTAVECFCVQDGVLTITATASEKVELCTQYHDASGGTYFRGGYFEARMRCSDWSAFWLYCADRPRVYGNRVLRPNPLTWTSEIDIIETDPGSANTAFCTVHKNTSGDGGVPDHRMIRIIFQFLARYSERGTPTASCGLKARSPGTWIT